MIVPPFTYDEFVFRAEQAGEVDEKYYKNQKFYFQPADEEHRIMLWDKNVIFFPRRINGKLVFLHRIRPGIQIVQIDDLDDLTHEFWVNYFKNFDDHIILDPEYKHESSYLGGGCPPIETDHGWLLIYHSVEEKAKGNVYSASAAVLLDRDNPSKVLARLPYPLFSPEYSWEVTGEVSNVVFPTGTALFDDTLYIYYGAADKCIAVVSLSISHLIKELLKCKPKK
jgi:beta-1,2-mannobiose phosphorylase / 1,2-beta-oligomannan phosphorylase